MLLLEEGSIERISSGIEHELEAIEDLNRSASLGADHAAVNPKVLRKRRGGGIPGGAGGGWRVELGLDPSEVIGDVKHH